MTDSAQRPVRDAQERKEARENRQIDALCQYLTLLWEDEYRRGKRLDLDGRSGSAPETELLKNGVPCGAVEVTSSAEEGQDDFEFDAVFAEHASAVETDLTSALKPEGTFTMSVPWPCDLSFVRPERLPELVKALREQMREFESTPDRRHLSFLFRDMDIFLDRECDIGSTICVEYKARFAGPPDAEGLKQALVHIEKKFRSWPGMGVGLIDVLQWPAVFDVDPRELTAKLKPKYPSINHLFLIHTSPEQKTWPTRHCPKR